jgi:hypothetical protein
MSCRIVHPPCRPIPVAVAAAAAILAIAISSGALAQTLADPNPQTKAPAPTVTTKSRPAAHVKDCSVYGAGFMAMPGSDMCIKIGGSVTVEAGH